MIYGNTKITILEFGTKPFIRSHVFEKKMVNYIIVKIINLVIIYLFFKNILTSMVIISNIDA